ncbi:MAG: D-glycero-beta-D-manno-heptose 1-phosphate adenylyltransferase [Candidatus Omnitrophota bacterium]|nr:D-glycero-beta-D-manno-heptose 1-phosphate adenylyltransferase [Candidatus Omnitrophota bacterium]
MPLSKIKNLNQLKRITAQFKKRDKKIVFTNGCFDILHFGHVKYLREAKKKGDILVVGLNSDSSVKKIKGKTRPLNREKERAYVLSGLSCVDFVVIFNEDTPYSLIRALKPDILVKGSDWHREKIVGADIVSKSGGKVFSIPFVKGFSTTKLINKIIETRPR